MIYILKRPGLVTKRAALLITALLSLSPLQPQEAPESSRPPFPQWSLLSGVGDVNCTLALDTGNRWVYAIYKEGQAVGRLTMEVLEYYLVGLDFREEKIVNLENVDQERYFSRVPVFVMSYEDSYQNKKYVQQILATWSEYYLFQGYDKPAKPYLHRYYRLGDRFNDLVVVSIEERSFNSEVLNVAVLKSKEDSDYEESYADGVGLFYYKKGDLEYKLESYDISEDCRRY